ncbi:hypothetical protein GE061_013698 [Apolygus lucorum]|uniref:Cilia- and flagella-associated protein 157 n=1 Tax=Apolygus lucorum TaxID=248454 RepID=A0A6A4KGF7_APOLU|nr:hypothetical protein GE061_013698 [Apolygus lucorum]
MGPKKNKGKKKSAKPEEVDEEKLAVLQKVKDQILVDQMNELSKLRQLMEAADTENRDLRNEMRRVERDSGDIIEYLRRRLGEKCEEQEELNDVNEALITQNTNEKNAFLEAMKVQEQQYNEMVEHLTSEIKALNSKLGNVEEYKEQRDILLDKNNKMESYLVTMVVRATAIEKEYEKANLIDKDRMRREMEEKLKKFSVDFQRATKARIAMATQNVIKENISINNELSLLIASWQKLHDENESMRTKNRYMAIELSTETEMREKLMKKNVAQGKLIDRLAFEYMKVDEFHNETKQMRKILHNLRSNIEKKENIISRARKDIAEITNSKQVLEDRLDVLRENLEKMTSSHERNANIIRRAREEIEESFLLDKKKLPNLQMDECQKKMGYLYDRLEDLFSEDWLLDVTATELKNVSVATIILPPANEQVIAEDDKKDARKSGSTVAADDPQISMYSL